MTVLLILPIGLFFIPLLYLLGGGNFSLHFVYAVIFSVNALIVGFLILDYVFGFTLWGVNKNAKPAHKVEGADMLVRAFNMVQKRFKGRKAKLYIQLGGNSVNAFAIGSLRKRRITIGEGLINSIMAQNKKDSEIFDAYCGVIAHEMSHLIHQDYLPGMLLYINQRAIDFISRFLHIILYTLLYVFMMLPFIRAYMVVVYKLLYHLLNKILRLFYRFIIMPLYRFLQHYLSRAIEYRCDRDSAHAVGPSGMIRVLQCLGKGSYITIFSTHPSSRARIKRLQNLRRQTTSHIGANWIDTLASLASLMMVLAIAYFFYHLTDFALLESHWDNDVVKPAKSILTKLWQWAEPVWRMLR